MIPEAERLGHILICESNQGMRETFTLMLGEHYTLTFADDLSEILPLLRFKPAKLLIWELHHPDDALKRAVQAVRADAPLDLGLKAHEKIHILDTLQAVRQRDPQLKIMLVSDRFDGDFQIAVIRRCGLVSLITKPWESSRALVEQIQAMLSDKKNSFKEWILRIPLATPTPAVSARRWR